MQVCYFHSANPDTLIWWHLSFYIYFFMNVLTVFNFETHIWHSRVDSRFAPRQWETVLLCNDVSHWLGASLESSLIFDYLATKYTYTNHHGKSKRFLLYIPLSDCGEMSSRYSSVTGSNYYTEIIYAIALWLFYFWMNSKLHLLRQSNLPRAPFTIRVYWN